jgi:hypothetical protein
MSSVWFAVLLVSAYVLTPLCVIWSWIRFARYCHVGDKSSWPSIAALILTTGSGLLAVGSLVFSGATGGFAYYDPRLLRIFRIGLLLSSLALLAALIGVAFRSSLRWQVPLASIGMLVFWLLAAAGE